MFSITKMKALWELFQQGKAVADPAKWKAHQITATMLGGFIIAIVQLAKAFGHEIPVDSDSATAIAGGVVAVTNIIFTITTSKHVGLPAPQQAVPSVQQNTATEPTQSSVQPSPVAPVEQQPVGPNSTEEHAALVERAREWAAKHRKFDNDQNPNYYAG
jgi:hypothetical protein